MLIKLETWIFSSSLNIYVNYIHGGLFKMILAPGKLGFFNDLGHERTAEVLQWYEFSPHLAYTLDKCVIIGWGDPLWW